MNDRITKPVLTLPQFGLYLYSLLTSFFGWTLIWLGGLVTSHEAGMTVPDWPTSFGYNMFLLPISQWTGGVLYEHTHRLLATIVGLLTVGLMILLFFIEKRTWVRRLGVIAVLLVAAQGLLGGFRVILAMANLGFLHGCLGQACFAVLAVISLITSPWWVRLVQIKSQLSPIRAGWIKHITWVTILIFLQLGLGAAMRHAHAGLSIPDFPTAYGHWWPHVTHERLAEINAERVANHEVPTSLALIHLQMTHRVMALFILLAVLASTAMLVRRPGIDSTLKLWSLSWSLLVVLQVFLGAYTILSHKAADVATAHVAVGALLLMVGVIQIISARHINQILSPVAQPEKEILSSSPA